MRRYKQSLEDVLSALAPVGTTWLDEHSTAVVAAVSRLPKKENYQHADVVSILDEDFNVGITLIRLVLAMSKDEFGLQMSQQLGGTGGVGVSRYRNEQGAFLKALDCLGFRDALAVLVNRPVDWKDILCERLRFGRGSAIKGQKRGRELENTTEEIVVRVFGKGGFDTRCRFVGSDETQTEKADFAIPTKSAPRILIECKAYGATGSKQTDILGDIERVVIKKRSDTHLLLVTDGISWTLRQNDLRKLIDWQNSGRITRIYTQRMAADLENDLIQLKREHSL